MLQTLTMLFFSPTGGTLRAARLLAQGLAEEITEVDLSLPQGKAMHFEEKDIVLIAGPVFGGRMPACFLERLAASQAAIQRQLQSPSMATAPMRTRCWSSMILWSGEAFSRSHLLRCLRSIPWFARLRPVGQIRRIRSRSVDWHKQFSIRLIQASLLPLKCPGTGPIRYGNRCP